jgi:hypothetical protein
MLALFLSAALASVFDQDLGVVLSPGASPLTANGISAPTVVWDPDDQLFVMFFETKTDASTAGGCAAGKWSIGAASSVDGVTWDVWDQPVVSPTPGTPYACVAAHPAAVYDNGQFHLWFKAEQGTAVVGTPAWGTTNYAGVGYATVDVRLDDKTSEIAAIDAQINALEAARDQAVLDYSDTLVQYEADLNAQSDEFACLSTAPVCAPCTSSRLAASRTGFGTRTATRPFCQDFGFVVPSDLTLTTSGLYVYGSAVLAWDGGTCTKSRFFGVTSFSCTVAPGTSVTTRSSSLAVTNVGIGTVSGSVTLAANNVQDVSGLILSDLQTLLAYTSVPNITQTASRLPGWITRLNTMFNWLNTAPVTPDEAFLRTETDVVRTEAQALQALITSTATQVADLQDDRNALLAYVPGVDASVMSGVALQLNSTFGYPSVAKIGGDWVMMLQQYPDLYRASGTQPDAFTLDVAPVVTAGTVAWADTEVFEPSLYCADDPVFPYVSWLAGRTVVGGLFSTAGASDAISDDGLAWLLTTLADFTWTDNNDYRHFDVVADDTGELRMYWIKRVGGLNEVHLKSTTTTWVAADTRARVCP